MPNKKLQSKTKDLTAFGKIWRIAICIAVPLGGGFLISMLTRNTMETFDTFNKPPLAPPAWLFPVAWTILYTLMGLASYFIFYAGFKSKSKNIKSKSKTALIIYGIQLAINFCWTLIFFNLGQFWFALVWLLIMWALIIALLVKAFDLSRPAFFMLLPYLLWTTFAGYLNCSIAILN